MRRAALAGVLLAVAIAAVGALAAWWVPLPARLGVAPSPEVRAADGQVLHASLAPDDRWRLAVSRDEVDPDYLAALLRFEDQRFDSHLGVDLVAIARAAVLNARSGQVVSGGSTLTMQLVRMLEPRPRTVTSKAIEALRAVQLELRLPKRSLLEAYLRYLPYGGNVEGLQAGALGLFGHRADALSDTEIATLLAIPQRPSVGRTDRPDALRVARDRVASVLGEVGAWDPERVAQVHGAALPGRLRPMPRLAPHAAAWLRPRGRVDTTLSLAIQQHVEERLRRDAPARQRAGVEHAAVVVVEHGTGEVRALASTPGFLSGRGGSQIPAFAVPRSPGSALKPVLYALAIDAGEALPGFQVPDVPTRYGAYAPTNYDGGFDGLVELEEALARSLNLPFIELARKVGVEPFLATLRRTGVRSLRPSPGEYGLSVAVGGLELTPLELAGVYATLARGGEVLPLRWLGGEVAGTDRAWGEGASWLTRRALSRRDRPDFPDRRALAAAPVSVHWKTGTSTGRRDGWAVGSGPRYTVAVWLGNLDQRSAPQLVGASAAPILFDLLEALEPRRAAADPVPAELIPIAVCAWSGHPAGDACPQRSSALARRDAVPAAPCPYHRTVEVDRATGLAVGPGCATGPTDERSFLVLPSGVRAWLSRRHRHVPEPPAWAPGCAPAGQQPPRILEPIDGQVALLLPGLPAEQQQLPLLAEADGPLSWFVDGRWLGEGPADERRWWTPQPGTHELMVSDSRGRSARRTFEVAMRR